VVAGEVFLTPVPGTAEGKVVKDRLLFRGSEVIGLRSRMGPSRTLADDPSNRMQPCGLFGRGLNHKSLTEIELPSSNPVASLACSCRRQLSSSRLNCSHLRGFAARPTFQAARPTR
jgi:hypothetical protein